MDESGGECGSKLGKNKNMQESIKVHARVQRAHALSRVRGVQGLLNIFFFGTRCQDLNGRPLAAVR